MSPRLSATAARRRPARRGTILVVVLALLAIFAVIGIAFVFYSDGEALAARYHREAQSANGAMRPSPPGRFESDFEDALGKITFGDYSGQLNGYRGHDLLSAIYGGNLGATGGTNDPYAGQGIFHEKMTAPFNVIPSRGHVVNYTAHAVGVDAKGNPAYFRFEPELTGAPQAQQTPGGNLPAPPSTATSPQVYISKAAPYTYPDLNNFYLASVIPGTGEVAVPSFYRAWHFNSNPVALGGSKTTPTAAPLNRRLEGWDPSDPVLLANTDWVIPEGRAKTIRPRPIDQLIAADFAAAGLPFPLNSQLSNYNTPALVKSLFLLIQTKIRAGTIIDYPRPNADGRTTGDVFNLIGGVGVQRNDSILVDFGGTPFEWPANSGQWVKPLAAVLISDLDGLLNINAHGNTRSSGGHISLHGLGPWEVNLAGAIGNVAEGNALVAARYGSTKAAGGRDGTAFLYFDPSKVAFGTGSQVNWDGLGKAGPIQLPGFATNPFNVSASYGGTGFYDDNTSTAKAGTHPALFNPGDWPAFPNNKALALTKTGSTYPPADTRRLHQGYGRENDLYQQATFARLVTDTSAPAPNITPPLNALVGNIGSYPPGTATYRNDPAHARRLMTTTLSADLDRPRLMGNATSKTGTDYPKLVKDAIHTANQGFEGTLTAGNTNNTATILPALDLNRPLADYRDLSAAPNVDNSKMPPVATPQPLSSTNIGNANAALKDRQVLARDIFYRLIIATGADKTAGVTLTLSSGDVSLTLPTGPTDASTTQQGFDGLRYLAQLAANAVDYIDTDDVSTPFVWNPKSGTDPTDPTSANYADNFADGELQNRVVFGVEMPRLVLNETYAEVTDDQAGKMNGRGKKMPSENGHVRFWVELLNPSYGASTGPIGDASVTFLDTTIRPYKIAIARNSKTGLTNADAALADASNVTGSFLPKQADLEYDFSDAGAANTQVKPNKGSYNPKGDPANGIVIVGPQVQGATPTDEFDPTNGGAAPPFDKMIQSQALAPTKLGQQNAMEYIVAKTDLPNVDPTDPNSPYRRHVVLLRRLANPYIAFDAATNPYVTVDVMDYVPANDAVTTGGGGGGGGVPMKDRFAVGRVQPLAGQAKADGPGAMNAMPTYTFPDSFLLAQKDNGTATAPLHTLGRHNGASSTAPAKPTYVEADPAAMPPTRPKLTDPAAKTPDTIMVPFDWYVHFDRPLLTEMELLHVQAVRPHQVTQYTFQKDQVAGEPVRRSLGVAPWLGVGNPTGMSPPPGYPVYDPATGLPSSLTDTTSPHANVTANGLYRAFEVLRGKSRVYGTAAGGRVFGKVNINTIQDARVLVALLDPQPGSIYNNTNKTLDVYDSTNPTSKDTVWGRLMPSRTKTLSTRTLPGGSTVDTTVPGKTIDDDPYDGNWKALDRPFKAYGVAEAGMTAQYGVSDGKTIVGGGNSVADDGAMPANPTPFGPGIQDTLLRVDPSSPNGRVPLAFYRPEAYGKKTDTPIHPYLQAEPLRKLANNVTTVSNVFSVHVTIVYHNVRMNTAAVPPTPLVESVPGVGSRAFLGSEAFVEVPGDMRRQYLAVVDRSNAVVDKANSNTIVKAPFQAATAGAFTFDTTKGTGTFTLANYQADAASSTVSVASDGQIFTLSASATSGINSLVVGSGADRQTVTISSIAVNTMVTPNTATITVQLPGMSPFTGTTYPAGSLVANGVTGRPTIPAAGFNPITAPDTFQRTQCPFLVPYAGRVR